jgi:hypothetical protein
MREKELSEWEQSDQGEEVFLPPNTIRKVFEPTCKH